jgi:hypothetical protein
MWICQVFLLTFANTKSRGPARNHTIDWTTGRTRPARAVFKDKKKVELRTYLPEHDAAHFAG